MSKSFWPPGENSNIDEIVKTLVANYHPHLADVEIRVLFTEKSKRIYLTPEKDVEQVIPGNVCISSNKKYMALMGMEQEFFIIELGHDTWQEYSKEEKYRILDEFLCQCGRYEDEETGEMINYMVPYDVPPTFLAVVQRHGLQTEELRTLYRVSREKEGLGVPSHGDEDIESD